jgi:hypothetical protein
MTTDLGVMIMKEGMEKGMERVAINMLQDSAEIGIIEKYTGLTEAEIKKLQSKLEPSVA